MDQVGSDVTGRWWWAGQASPTSRRATGRRSAGARSTSESTTSTPSRAASSAAPALRRRRLVVVALPGAVLQATSPSAPARPTVTSPTGDLFGQRGCWARTHLDLGARRHRDATPGSRCGTGLWGVRRRGARHRGHTDAVLLSIRGIARRPPRPPGWRSTTGRPARSRWRPPTGTRSSSSPSACPLFVALTVTGIDPPGTSPLWLARRGQMAGGRDLNGGGHHQLRDVETGQPIHYYDRATLEGPILVRQALEAKS